MTAQRPVLSGQQIYFSHTLLVTLQKAEREKKLWSLGPMVECRILGPEAQETTMEP